MTPVETFNYNNQQMPHTDEAQLREIETLRKTHTHLREEREYNKRKDHAHAHGLPKTFQEGSQTRPDLGVSARLSGRATGGDPSAEGCMRLSE